MVLMEFNNNNNNTDDVPIGLPRTVEGAANRYLNQYERHFKGPYTEMRRLRAEAEAKIVRLRRKAPTFHEAKLPLLINQACSHLLTCDTSTASGIAKFNDTHNYFCKILNDLARSQPADEVSFQKELDRVKARDKLKKDWRRLKNLIAELECKEFEADDLGDDDEDESEYAKTFEKLDKYKAELKIVVHKLAQMEGEDIEDTEPFELEIPKRSVLHKLTIPQQKLLKEQFVEFLKKFKKTRELYMDASHIEKIIDNLNLNSEQRTDLREINKAALDAYRSHFRRQENKKRDEYFDELLTSEHLKPREGEILENPDDLPEEVLEQLDHSDRISKRKLEDMEEEFIRRQGNLEATQTDDEVEDEDELDANEEQLRKELERNAHLYKRIKEEPVEEQHNFYLEDAPVENEADDDAPVENEPDDDDDPEPLIGVVAPSDKIPIIDISDDD